MNIRLSLILILILSSSVFAQFKLKADEIVQRHLTSIGTPDALASIKSIIVVGNTRTDFRGFPTPNLTGVAQLGSENDKVLLAMVFNEIRYPYEKAGYNGKDFSISRLPTGERSALGDFLMSNNVIFKEGLIGGALSSAWSLQNLDLRKAKVSYSGIEKLNSRSVYKLRYTPRKESDELRIDLFFDTDTFQHVRTEYQLTRSARIGGSSTLGVRESDTFFKMTEEFSNFRTEGKLMLPHTYRLVYTRVQKEQSQWLEWTSNFSTFVFNQPIDVKAYEVSAK